MANRGIAGQLNHLRILKMCESIIQKGLITHNPTKLMKWKMAYAVEMYKKSIPQTTNLDGNLNLTGRMILIRSSTAYKGRDKNEGQHN